MAGRTRIFFVLLNLLVFLAAVKAACNTTEPLVDPDPNDYTVNVTFSAYIAQISLREGTGNIRIAVFNCDESDVPTIGAFNIGNKDELGLDTEESNGQWFLVVKAAQDYETPSQTEYNFFVEAGGSKLEVVIYVYNVDDNAPYFNFPDSASCEISEIHIGPSACHLWVYDLDGIMEGMTYTVTEKGNISEDIELIPSTEETCDSGGKNCIKVVLNITNKLDYFESPVHSLLLEVLDGAGHSGSITYIVQVKAENKEKPTITPKQLTAEIDEKYSGIIDFDNVSITVTDSDSLDYGQFSITLEGNEADGCYEAFDVIPRAGYRNTDVKISVIDPGRLDYDEGKCKNVIMKIKATEEHDKTHIGEAEVNIKLKDLNDEIPVFEKEDFVFNVTENENGTVLGNVKATDLDDFDSITYSLTSETYLTIDPETGEVSVKAAFNYERQPQLIVTVKAEDTNETPHVAYAQITVNVIDINDEKPELYMPSSPTSIYENTTIGAELDVDISATDEDSDPQLSFAIDWDNSRAAKQGMQTNKEDFKNCIIIETKEDPDNKKSAKAVLKVNKELDWETYDTLYLIITVEDLNTNSDYTDKQSSSATLTITIDDVNDNPPIFSPIEKLSFKEGSEKDQLIGIITATDPDGKDNNEVIYSLVQNDFSEKQYVTINKTTGELRTGEDKIDYEEITAINCTVNATDGVYTTDKLITIEIEDINDETPYFIGDYSKPIEVEENTVEKRELLFIKADDNDISPGFKTLRFEMEKIYKGIFEIDSDTGEVYVPAGSPDRLDYEDTNTYSIEITVKDRCNSGENCYGDSRSATTRITINLIDLNDNVPKIQNPGATLATVSEAVREGAFLSYVTAVDEDCGGKAKLTYTLENVEPEKGSDLFTINNDADINRGTITAKKDLENEWGKYSINVSVHDVDDNTDSSIFYITVIDINNNKPVFIFPDDTTEIRLNIEGNEVDKVLTDVQGNQMIFKAVDDLDNGVNGTAGMRYTITGDETALQYLKMSSDELRLKEQFTEDMKNKFTLIVTACDGEIEMEQCTTKETPIRMRVNREHEPTFVESAWETTFTENKTGLEQRRPIDVAVTDLNNDEECDEGVTCLDDILYYFIIDGNDDKFFHLDKGTGVLSLNEELDREAVDVHIFTVVVTNFEKGPPSQPEEKSKLNVTIHVSDEIDTPPAFIQSLFAAGINTGDKSGDNVTVFTATDEDLNDDLEYKIIEETMEVTDDSLNYWMEQNPFVITGNTLKLNFDVQDSSLKGLFKFNVEVSDNGDNKDVAACQIYIITQDNHVIMRLQNNASYAESRKFQMATIFTNVFKWQGNVKKIAKALNSEGQLIDERTDVTAYFVNGNNQEPIAKEEITRALNNKETYTALRDALLGEKLVLESIDDSETESSANMEGVLQTVLIVVSVVLGLLVVVLFAAFFVRTRSLNRRLEALSTTKFGSQDSGLNRIGMTVPNTNRHAVEGSNPVWGAKEDFANHDFDNESQSSGDSELIGIEESPEFSPNARNGILNEGFTPDIIENGQRTSINPMLNPGFEPRVSFNPLSAAALQDFTAGSTARRQSVNPMAGTFNGEDSDFENDSRRSSENSTEQNSNFTYMQGTNSTPTTEL